MIKEAGFTTLEMEMECNTFVVLAVKRGEESERGALKGFSSGSWLGDFYWSCIGLHKFCGLHYSQLRGINWKVICMF
jgi:hypothetical protein